METDFGWVCRRRRRSDGVSESEQKQTYVETVNAKMNSLVIFLLLHMKIHTGFGESIKVVLNCSPSMLMTL